MTCLKCGIEIQANGDVYCLNCCPREVDLINHPPHYKAHPSGIECIEITRHMNFNCGNAVKYIWRNGLKDQEPSIKDLQKAIWYLNDEIKRLTK